MTYLRQRQKGGSGHWCAHTRFLGAKSPRFDLVKPQPDGKLQNLATLLQICGRISPPVLCSLACPHTLHGKLHSPLQSLAAASAA